MTPSAGAVRAAGKVHLAMDAGLDAVAEVIDRESGLADLLEALRGYLTDHDEDADDLRRDAGFNDPTGGCDCGRCVDARAAIAKIGGRD